MKKRGKRYHELVKLFNKKLKYTSKEAVELCLQAANAKFDETIEVHVKLSVDSRQANQQVRGTLVLPNGNGKNLKILVICKNENVDIAKKSGADLIGSDEYIEKIQSGWFDFDVLITTPDMMPTISKLGKILGPKGLMPNPKLGTVTSDIRKAITEIKLGKIEYRTDKNNIVHCYIGKKSFGSDKILENFESLMNTIAKARPVSIKSQYIRSCFISSTMGLGIAVNENSFMAV
ncbi:MAG: 50S ribosomal protein L1 [Candidatus Improbicoccus pseudotrichonymphae]|uniref:Large ribosomal subunit protein uL1 n=1 Tax=Candidatus Improbicoccus pseudotrichonymphae TaxID=3033792 RepID=A0AA48KZE1_9FIRM|nr:MAG: 50S ribosomal protein L1 [Candidatus Improbicoccus pseudotrichonymphae]